MPSFLRRASHRQVHAGYLLLDLVLLLSLIGVAVVLFLDPQGPPRASSANRMAHPSPATAR